MPQVPRLIDLHIDWLLQYVGEATIFDHADYPRAVDRLGQAEGYLETTWAGVVACYRSASDWNRRTEPWPALTDLLCRIEAEFCGRLLIGPDDFSRWKDDATGLTWAIIGV